MTILAHSRQSADFSGWIAQRLLWKICETTTESLRIFVIDAVDAVDPLPFASLESGLDGLLPAAAAPPFPSPSAATGTAVVAPSDAADFSCVPTAFSCRSIWWW